MSLCCYGLETANLIDYGNWVSCFGKQPWFASVLSSLYLVVGTVADVIKSPKAFCLLNEKVEFLLGL